MDATNGSQNARLAAKQRRNLEIRRDYRRPPQFDHLLAAIEVDSQQSEEGYDSPRSLAPGAHYKGSLTAKRSLAGPSIRNNEEPYVDVVIEPDSNLNNLHSQSAKTLTKRKTQGPNSLRPHQSVDLKYE